MKPAPTEERDFFDRLLDLSVIVVTARPAGAPLRGCLAALARQAVAPGTFEVVVAVAGAAAGAPPCEARPYPLRVTVAAGHGWAAAANQGLALARGRFCLFLDDSLRPAPGLLAAHLAVQGTCGGAVGLGRVTPRRDGPASGFARYFARRRAEAGAALAAGRAPSPLDVAAGNLSAPRAALLAAGGFATDLPGGAGIDLGCRLQAQGLALVAVPDAFAEQDARMSARQVATAAERAGRAAVALYRRHPALLPHLELGAFSRTSARAVLLRRLLLAGRMPVAPLLAVGPLLGGRPWAREWYRFLASYCYWRGVRAAADPETWARLTHGATILMYHAVGAPGEPAGCYIIPVRRFARQMAWLRRRGYPVIGLEALLHDRQAHRLPPAHAFVLTFDDGYADNGRLAAPILRRHGFPATIFVVSGAVGGSNGWDREGELVGRPLLDWPALRALQGAGVAIGAHTRRHIPLTTVSPARVAEEVAGSRADLEAGLGRPVVTFAYPHGKLDPGVVAAVARAGYRGACSSYGGVNDPEAPHLALRRIEIRGTDSLLGFALAPWRGRARFRRRPA